jgi:predicted esterase
MNRSIASVMFLILLGSFSPVAAGLEPAWDTIRRQASERFGEQGERAAAFLAANRPERDADLDADIVLESIGLAIEARERFPWAGDVPEALWLNDVVPYAVLDEPRVASRARMLELAVPIVEGATTAEEAAQLLNREMFKQTGVRYSTQRRRANQNAVESMEIGLASCTGLSIMLVDACRSVGIPARVAGIASWTDRNGNHTWVEIHDGRRWRFTGAAEHDPNGLDRGWFAGAAGQAIRGHELHAIWASSFARTGDRFPLAWDMEDRSIPGVDVSDRYARRVGNDAAAPALAIRLWESRGGVRLASQAHLEHADQTTESETHADPMDINRVAEFVDPGVRPLTLRLAANGQTRTATLDDTHQPGAVIELYWDELGLSREDAAAIATARWQEHAAALREERAAELESGSIEAAGYEMKILHRSFGEAPEHGHSLWISMHGGGGAPTEVNDQQWQNQIRLYEPEEGIYVAPRAPSDTWNLWHRAEIDRLFDRLIESAVIVWGINPDRVYLMGYSAGGDGVYQLAPRMADRFAAASMMAGHPNDADPAGLRNLPFAIFMGGEDSAYSRNTVAQRWGEQLAALRDADDGGYRHLVRIYPGLGHWMERRDAEALPWMAGFTRDPWPDTVVWRISGPPHARYYWLSVPEEEATGGRVVRARVDGQTVFVDTEDFTSVNLWLSDKLVDLDRPVRVFANGVRVFEGVVHRSEAAIDASLRARPDPSMIATARLPIPTKKTPE